MKNKIILGVLVSAMVLVVGISYSKKNAVQATDVTPVTNTNAVIDYYYKAEIGRPAFESNGERQSLSRLIVNHYVDTYAGQSYLYMQEQYFDISEGIIFNPKEHYLNFDFTEWDSEYSYNSLSSDESFWVSEKSNDKIINYYYKADVAAPSFGSNENQPKETEVLTQLTVNHHVDNYTDYSYLFKQDQYFNIADGVRFDPKNHYLNFDYSEWDPEYSHNNLASDKPFLISDYAKLGKY